MANEFSDKLTTEERKELPSSDFGLPETREFPMPDGAHVRAAEAYFRYAPEDKKVFIGTSHPVKSGRIRCRCTQSGDSGMG